MSNIHTGLNELVTSVWCKNTRSINKVVIFQQFFERFYQIFWHIQLDMFKQIRQKKLSANQCYPQKTTKIIQRIGSLFQNGNELSAPSHRWQLTADLILFIFFPIQFTFYMMCSVSTTTGSLFSIAHFSQLLKINWK